MSSANRVTVERMPIAGGDSGYLLARPEQPDGRNALLMHGYMSNPYHLEGLAKEMAAEGVTVGVVEYGEPLSYEQKGLPSDYKHRRACMVIDDMETRVTSDEWIFAAHSYGGVVQGKLLEDAPVIPDEANFICALGFGEAVKVLHPDRLGDVVGLYGAELSSAAMHGRNILNIHALAAQTATLLHRGNRIAEINEIIGLETDCVVDAVKKAEENGVDILLILAGRDHVVKPAGTLRSMEGKARIVVFEDENHFLPITRPHLVVEVMRDSRAAADVI